MVHIFVINPNAGNARFTSGLREQLSRMPDLEYYLFNIRYPGNEKELIPEILHVFDDETIRIYVCGGSGTFRNVLSALPDPGQTEIAFFPCGLTNDFLKVFGQKEELFYDVANLIDGEVYPVDYMRTDYGLAINTISVGMDSTLSKNMEDIRYMHFLNAQVPYYLSLFKTILTCRSNSYEWSVGSGPNTIKSFEVVIGNGAILGGNLHFMDSADVRDGSGTICFGCNRNSIAIIPAILSYINNDRDRVDKNSRFQAFGEFTLKRSDGLPMDINMDGELVKNVPELDVTIVKRGLPFVVPKGVKP